MSNRPLTELEELHKRWTPIAMEIANLWLASGSPLKQEKWVAKYLPERLADYLEAERVFDAVMDERVRWREELHGIE